jgi:hypothetical protein
MTDIFNNYNPTPPGRYGINDAIESLRPGALYRLRNTTFEAWWHHQPAPTIEELMAECERLKSIAYKQCRREEYPPIEDFVDAYYWLNEGNDSLMTQYLQKVKEVKEKYPKPEASDANV